ncbi:hypothetical protein L6452_18270 [Arctium lappa]|uniref:Uncharacterized protein n=1 Tax=Arctium lappa TaxID=4217 RepID=A0ACB9C5W2_ARCLA|nr:hypothetical protein L6452_18270 [Arctium lappa]
MENENQESNHELWIKEVPSNEEVGQMDHKYKFGARSQSFPQRSSIINQELGEEQHGYNRCNSDVLGRGEKQPLHLSDSPELAKKPRDWTLGDGYLHLSNSRGDQPSGITQPCNVYAEEKQLFFRRTCSSRKKFLSGQPNWLRKRKAHRFAVDESLHVSLLAHCVESRTQWL